MNNQPTEGTLLRLVLSTPVSVNSLYIPVAKGKLILSPAGSEYKEAAGWAARDYMMRHGIEMARPDQPIGMLLDWHRAEGKRGDLTNLVKCLEDAFSGIVYPDDDQIVASSQFRYPTPAPDSWIEVLVWVVKEYSPHSGV